MVQAGVAEAERNFAALVVGNDAPNFSAGANLMLLLLEAHDGNWDEIDLMVRTFQRATMSLRYAQVPVVAAPAGLTLGGGCEVVLHADRVQAAAETYVGLVEVGVGLIPAGAGTKEMLARAVEPLAPTADLLAAVQRVFETIGFARVSTSAHDAIGIGYLRDVDGVSMNRERLMADAKRRALERVRDGYQAPQRRAAIRVGGESLRATLELGVHLAWRAGRISDHDALIGRKLAWILAGGATAARDRRDRRVPAGSRTRGVPLALRRTEDARAHPAHVEDGEDAQELTLTSLSVSSHPTERTNDTTRADERMIDIGSGIPLVLVPGIQGRWEWMRPTV